MVSNARIAVVALSVLAAGWLSRPADSAPAAGQPRQWEYATLAQTETLCILNNPARDRDALTMLELYKDMGGKSPDKTFDLSDMFTLLGQDGWEYAGILQKDALGTIYLFKRQL